MSDEQLIGLFAAIDTYSVRSWKSDSDRDRIAAYVNQLLAAERAAVVAAMLEYLPANSHEKITADVLRKLGEKRE